MEVVGIGAGQNHLDDKMTFKCSQCEYTSFRAGPLRSHLKSHSGQKRNKCNQCDYVSSQAGKLRRHLQMHSREKSHKCNQCDYASFHAGDFRRHLKTQWRKVKQMQPIWLCILWSRPFEDSFDNAQWRKTKQMQSLCIKGTFAANVTLNLLGQSIWGNIS